MNMMELTSIQGSLILALAVLVVAGIAMALFFRSRRTGRLRGRFGGAEYDRAVSEGGGRRRAEAALDLRAVRVESFHVQPLAPVDRTRFQESWPPA